MTIPHFADAQNLVFVPALIAALIGTLLICLPIVFAPTLRRRRGSGRALTAVALALGAVALVVGGLQTAAGVQTLQAERQRVHATIRERYGVVLDAQQVGSLVDGGSPRAALPAKAAALGLPDPSKAKPLKLVPQPAGSDSYVLTLGGKPLPAV